MNRKNAFGTKVGTHCWAPSFIVHQCLFAKFFLSVKQSVLSDTIQNTFSVSASVLQVMLMRTISQCASLHVSHSAPLWSFTIGCLLNHPAQKKHINIMLKGVSHQTMSLSMSNRTSNWHVESRRICWSISETYIDLRGHITVWFWHAHGWGLWNTALLGMD